MQTLWYAKILDLDSLDSVDLLVFNFSIKILKQPRLRLIILKNKLISLSFSNKL